MTQQTEQTDRVHARCTDCGKGYWVVDPDPDHSYTCKACAGAVRVDAEPTEDELPDSVLETLDPELRREASCELRDGYRSIAMVTWLFWLGAFVYGAVTVFAVLAMANPDVPVGGGFVVVALSALLTAVMLMGSLQILFSPYTWTLAVAVLASVVTVAHLIGPNPFGVAFLGSAAWAAAFWWALVPTRRFKQLIESHADLYIEHHASRKTKRSLEGRSPRERHERLLRAMRNASVRAWRISAAAGAGILVASAFGSYSVWANSRPQELAPVRAAFETAWNERNLEGATRHFPVPVRAREAERVANVVQSLGWEYAMPRLAGGTVREDGARRWIDYAAGQTKISACWAPDGMSWDLVQLDLPRPPLEPAVERFTELWRASDVKAVAGLFPFNYQERQLEAMQAAVERRGWQPLPEIRGSETTDGIEEQIVVTFAVDDGPLVTKWVFRNDGTWGLHAIQFPKARS